MQELVNELVPEAERTKGPEADSLDGSTVALAQTTITWRLYKNISVEELGLVGEPRGKLVAIIKWEDRDCTGPVY